jgi:hypothetical protein
LSYSIDILMEMIEFERKVEIIDLTGPGQMTADKLVESRLLCLKEEKVSTYTNNIARPKISFVTNLFFFRTFTCTTSYGNTLAEHSYS